MGFVVQPVPFVDISISMLKTTKAMSFVILPLTWLCLMRMSWNICHHMTNSYSLYSWNMYLLHWKAATTKQWLFRAFISCTIRPHLAQQKHSTSRPRQPCESNHRGYFCSNVSCQTLVTICHDTLSQVALLNAKAQQIGQKKVIWSAMVCWQS